LTHEAANALLKTLEEPPPASYLFLLSEDEERMLPTIASRCQRLVLAPVPTPLLREALVERWGATAEQAETLAEHARGRLGWAVEALADPVLLNEAQAQLVGLVRLVEEGLAARLSAAASLAQQASDDPEATLVLGAMAEVVEGVLLAKSGLAADERQAELARRLSWQALLAAARSATHACAVEATPSAAGVRAPDAGDTLAGLAAPQDQWLNPASQACASREQGASITSTPVTFSCRSTTA
jgi:DNA polymerase III delta prime subunit